ncbi:thiol reductase thioredoxin [Bacteroides heparinolyticus]|uniref:thioredoxin family protein n=1 Tax=Prevotella heparinolytica TaxID=28113 RepID=UPI000D031D8E|nr:thioredoxin domain-containing protein [Bacteroides heparinolyticus]AVM57205.1 thiol reductase thioredoxin [Bacteroides heparinolyticus]
MKKTITMAALLFSSVLTFACTDRAKQPEQTKTGITAQKEGSVIVMTKEMFIKEVFDYEKSSDWKYKGTKPAIIDLYADWCGPCRMTAPIMKDLAKEYADKIVIYKVNVDKEKELAGLFNATSIPLFVFIPMNGTPQFFRGAADKVTYKKVIDDFLLKTE